MTGYAGSSRRPPLGWARSPRRRRRPTTAARRPRRPRSRPRRDVRASDLETIIEQIEADVTNFLNRRQPVNTDYTKLLHRRDRHAPGRVLSWPRRGRTCTRSFRAPAARPPGPTSSTARKALASRSGRTSSSTSRGATGSALGSLNGGLSSPGASRRRLGGEGRASAALGSAQTVGKLSVPPSWAGATPAIRLASTALPDDHFRCDGGSRDRHSDEPAQPGHAGQSDGRRAGQPGRPRRQLNGRPGPRDLRRASAQRDRSSSTRSSPTYRNAGPSAALERRRGRARRPGRAAVHQTRHPRGARLRPMRKPRPQPQSPNPSLGSAANNLRGSKNTTTIEGGSMKSLLATPRRDRWGSSSRFRRTPNPASTSRPTMTTTPLFSRT